MGKKKRPVNPKCLTNLKGHRGNPIPEAEVPESEPIEPEIDSECEDLIANTHHDSTRPGWVAQDDGSEDEDFDDEDSKENGQWRGDKLVREGIYREIVDAAKSGLPSRYLGDVEDEEDDDYLDAAQFKAKRRRERERKDRPKLYATGPDIARKAERTRRRLAQSWKGQSSLDGFLSTQRRQASSSAASTPRSPPIASPSFETPSGSGDASIKAEDNEIDITMAYTGPCGVPDVPIREETPSPIQLEFLDREIRQESLTPPPLYFDEDYDSSGEVIMPPVVPPSSETLGKRKRQPSVEMEDMEDEDAPGNRPAHNLHPPDGTLLEPVAPCESWEEELEDDAHPVPVEIRPWDVLRKQINECLDKKFKTYTAAQVNQYIILRSFATLRLRKIGRMEASRQIAIQWQDDVNGSGVYFARRIRALARHYQIHEELPAEKRGGYRASRGSLLRDESVRNGARDWLTAQKIGSVTPQKFRDGLNREILPGLGVTLKSPLCTKTALRWLVKLGWVKTTRKKGVYMDGHEREDVVKYRNTHYIPKMVEYQRRMSKYTPGPDGSLQKTEPTLNPGEKELIAVFQDESCFHANEHASSLWVKPGQQVLMSKSRGRLIHVSEYILESTGRLVVRNEDGSVKREARKIIHPGSNGDPWWDRNQLIKQVKDDVLPVFEEANPGKQALLVFDQSSAHAALAEDALKAFEMNKSDGGAQKPRHDTIIPMNNPDPRFRGKPQSMTTKKDGKDVPKGLETVLKERGFDVSRMRAKCNPVCPLENERCCMARLLSRQDDFATQISELEQVILDAGHLCIFLPKFHCELNPIEMYWGWAKYRYRNVEKKTFESAKQAATKYLNECPTDVIRRFINRSWRFLSAYENGLKGSAAAWAVRQYKGHRCISNRALIQIEALAAPRR